MTNLRAKRSGHLGLGGSCNIYMGTFDLTVLKVIGIIRCTCLKRACNSKTAGRRAKRSEIWDLAIVVVCIWDIFCLLVFKVMLGSSSEFVSKWPLTRKQLAVERNGVKSGTCG